ncbi:hypothetical protein NECID01_1202 [Nematocida sp. AWRm77]|nr:hypothetical protein NECID01_1202 [Nematocida sp. AWRm77]
MGRITSLMLAIFVALVSVHCTQLSTNFILGDGTKVSDEIPREAFEILELQDKYKGAMQKSLHGSEAQEKEKEDGVTMFLRELPNKAAYARFKSLWNNEEPSYLMYYITAPYEWFKSLWSNTPSIYSMEITAEEFQNFVLAANYLNIQGEYAKHFGENMAKRGLHGTHSADIVASEDLYNYDLSYDIFRGLLYAFLRQAGFKHRVVHSSTEQTVLLIESTNEDPKKINKEYTGSSQTARMRTVLYTELGPAGTEERERNEAVLVWLLSNIGGSSVDIQYPTCITSEAITNFSQTIQKFTKENKKGARVYVEGLSLYVEYEDNISLIPAFQLVPALSRLELYIIFSYLSDIERFSLVSSITSCKSLKTLKITNPYLKSVEISMLVESLPNIEQLGLWCTPLKETAIDSLKKCVQLERLEIWGKSQLSTTVQTLVTHLLSLRELSIGCQSLTSAAAEAFQACIKLEKLKLFGRCLQNTVAQVLVTHLQSLRELTIVCEALTPAAAKAFQACTRLEKLDMLGVYQPSTAVEALVTRLQSLRELGIKCQSLTPAAAEAFQACTRLEKLVMNEELQPNTSCLVKLLEALPSLQYLKIKIDTTDLDLADALRNCSNLYSLWLSVDNYIPGFLAQYLHDPLPSLRSLKLYRPYGSIPCSEEDLKAVEEARQKGIIIYDCLVLR